METKGEKQSSSERVYKVALVSSSEKFNGAMLHLLPKNRFSPISVYRDAKSARRVISKEKPDIVIINTPLPDDFGTSLALDVSETDGVCVLLFTRAENFSELSSVLAPHGGVDVAETHVARTHRRGRQTYVRHAGTASSD